MHQINLNVIDSTNVYAKQHSQSFPQGEITCITADEQTAGVGRFQRHWVSPKDVGLYATFYFTLPARTRHLSSLAQIMALSLASVLQHEGLKPEIKWPNDVRLHKKKVSGVLCETQFHADKVEIFLGIGVNVNLDAAMIAHIDQPATSLLLETGKKWAVRDVLKKLQMQFVQDLERFKKEGFTPFHRPFDQLLALKGETVRC
ncbi:MAG: biotin--[acetyl-CoA-carboxylase] ligase, partial [Verrucomicrobiota bacterium]|nr:biotin--[acetyl-CoA-carboxylase] ligase [Verrucomicrobiota bacterium]